MKQAIIDIGSNSIRLKCYSINENNFKILFRDKLMAGLAGYITNGNLSNEGIKCACACLLVFKKSLKRLQIDNVYVFATASLRNISNTDSVISVIKAATGYSVEVLSGESEALLGYAGAMHELHLADGAFLDIGGASTEIVTFRDGVSEHLSSFPIGSLNLYHGCVKKILPGQGSLKRLDTAISCALEPFFHDEEKNVGHRSLLVGSGGTARAALKLSRHYYGCEDNCRSITSEQIEGLCDFLCSGRKDSIDMLLRMKAERIHTMVPGLLILRKIIHLFHAKQIIISKYGVREGYLLRRISGDDILPAKDQAIQNQKTTENDSAETSVQKKDDGYDG